jgi:hypothetical protein
VREALEKLHSSSGKELRGMDYDSFMELLNAEA